MIKGRWLKGVALICGFIGALICGGSITYPVAENAWVGGFPIPAYGWELINNKAGWEDVVSPLTLPIMLIDFLIGFAVFGGVALWLLGRKGST